MDKARLRADGAAPDGLRHRRALVAGDARRFTWGLVDRLTGHDGAGDPVGLVEARRPASWSQPDGG